MNSVHDDSDSLKQTFADYSCLTKQAGSTGCKQTRTTFFFIDGKMAEKECFELCQLNKTFEQKVN